MNRTSVFLILLLFAALVACDRSDTGSAESAQATPFDAAIHTSPQSDANAIDLFVYRAPDYADLEDPQAFADACEAEVASLRKAMKALESFEGTPTVENYLEAYNAQQVSMENMQLAGQTLAAVHPDEEVRNAAEACEQSISSVNTDMSLSRPIYDRITAIDLSAADAGTRRSVEKTLLSYRLSGVDKDEETRARIKSLNEEIVAIGQEFDRNILESVKYLELESVDQLAGLPEDYIEAHQPDENGTIRISTQYPDLFPFLQYADDHELRRQITLLYNTRAYPENEEVLMELLRKRYELAQLLGFENFAQRITADKMVGSPERVESFLEELTGYTEEAQNVEYEVLLARLQEDLPDAERVETWQRSYLTEKVQQEQYNVDSKEVRQYFNYNDTREGILTLVQDLFGVEFRPWDTHVWHDSVTAHEMWDDGELLGRFYLDMHPREGKYQHAAAFPIQNGITGVQVPVASLVCNFPAGNGLMQHSQVVTFLHEFGHLIHFLFAGGHHWDNVSGITTEWDFVEAPSQMLQEWVWDYDTISTFAKNAEGETIPRDLLDRMIAARDFGLGIGTRRQLSFAALSMGIYNRNPEGLDLKEITDEMTRSYTPFEPMDGEHFYTSFGHLNGYSAIYYTYQWSLAIATDMFTRFEKDGLRNVETAGAYRDSVLGQGGAKPAAELVTDFLGREISFKPYADRLSGAAKTKIETKSSGG